VAQAQAATGRLEASRAALLETIEIVVEPLARVGLSSACATVEQLLGRHRDAHDRLQGALDQLRERDSVEGVSLMLDLAWDALLDAEYGRMLEWGLAALEAARPLGDPTLTASASAITTLAASSGGAIEQARAYRAETLAIVDNLPDEVLASRPHALQWLSASELFLGHFDEGIAHAQRGIAAARASGQGQLLPGMTHALGGQLILRGRLAEAAELLDGAVDAARLTDNAVGLSWALANRAFAAVMEGDVETAMATGEEGVSLTRRLEHGFVRARASAVVAGALLQSGEPERAAELLEEGTGGGEMPLVPGIWRLLSLEVLTRCRLALGQETEAERAAALAQEIAASFGLPFGAALADRASAAVALAAGDAGTAAALALSSAAHADEVAARVEAALSRTLAGRALAQAGDPDRAAAELERAAAELEACGALRRRDEAEHELRKLGRTVHRRTKRGDATAGGVESLTGRELEVARLVVARRTNPQIAAELFLSIKTVEAHLRNIFRKLDAGSRVEVARIVERAQAG
jgi:ATP/maltotriose-dependent transcriptional regulator MalT